MTSMSLLNPKVREIKEFIKDNESRWGHAEKILYSKCIEDIRKIKISEIEQKEIKSTVRTFLVDWGGMARVLESPKRKSKWQNGLKKSIQTHKSFLESTRKLDLEKTNLNNYENDIINCYLEIKNAVGPTSASKVLHMLSPDFFPIWDKNVREKIRKECKPRRINESENGYYNFMLVIKDFLIKYRGIIHLLSKRYKKSKLRIFDYYIRMACNK